jgi:hypothetical protein
MIASHFFSNREGGYQSLGIFLTIFLGVGFGFIAAGLTSLSSVLGVYTILAVGSSLDTQPPKPNKQLKMIKTLLNII